MLISLWYGVKNVRFYFKSFILVFIKKNLSDHSYNKKWGVLEKFDPDNESGIAGYLQVDLSIISSDEPPAPVVLLSYDDDIVET